MSISYYCGDESVAKEFSKALSDKHIKCEIYQKGCVNNCPVYSVIALDIESEIVPDQLYVAIVH
jgi:hypothetical protein